MRRRCERAEHLLDTSAKRMKRIYWRHDDEDVAVGRNDEADIFWARVLFLIND